MNKDKLTRRSFIQKASMATVGTVAGTFAGRGAASEKTGDLKTRIDTSRILNYNPKMHYRRLGKTNLMISEVSLGGHWRAPWTTRMGGWWWGKSIRKGISDEIAKNRTDVVSKAIDCGMNYMDITGAEECIAFGTALKGRREKMIVGADDSQLCPRHDEFCNVKAQIHNVEECLRNFGTDYLDIWRIQAKMDGTNTDADVEMMIEAFQKLHKDGKAKHLGISSHSRPWTQHVIEKYPQVEMFIFPCTARTKEKNKPPVGNNIEERNPGSEPEAKSVFQSLHDNDVGLITIKPFFGGGLLKTHDKIKTGAGNKEDNDLAKLTLQCILNLNDAVTAVIPGLSTVYEVENAAMASYTRPLGQTVADKQWLEQMTNERWAVLPQDYVWLHDWQVV